MRINIRKWNQEPFRGRFFLAHAFGAGTRFLAVATLGFALAVYSNAQTGGGGTGGSTGGGTTGSNPGGSSTGQGGPSALPGSSPGIPGVTGTIGATPAPILPGATPGTSPGGSGGTTTQPGGGSLQPGSTPRQ